MQDRVKGHTKQRKLGKPTEWESPLVVGLGADWRHKRDLCCTFVDWIKFPEDPIKQTLTKWRLLKPRSGNGRVEDMRPAKRRKRIPDSKPEAVIHLHPSDWLWEGRGFRIVVDCQPLARALNGISLWTYAWGAVIFHNTCNLLQRWVVKRRVPDLLAQPVVWRERGYNKMVDYLANKSMDTQSSWRWQHLRPMHS